ncbi:hypothetical protein FHP29_02425 [Nocardioides albidus]|uniref:Uncharacterized protein n=1 Tax=Nocardioides albidus TaxID=1517589 RepID=A0A5C4WIZ9_9ACTN|nr:hypothetical protein [Nocardioides albidus]TNM48167.1 hypothetical protein FHP29_02425 [Nocardioides albidus]
MSHPITDAGVARLPIREGRAELLEEIMTLAPVETPDPAPVRRRSFAPVLIAVAAVLAVVGGTAWLGLQRDGGGRASAPVASAPATPTATGGRAVLTAPGWTVRNVQDHPDHGGELSYEKDGRQLDVHWRPADSYASYVADRNDIGTPVEIDLLGRTSLMWAYSRRDHTVIRPVADGYTLEVRGSGMKEAAFRALLGELTLVDEKGFQQSLPDEAVVDAERPAAVQGILADIPLPDGFDPASITSHELSRYHLIADVTGTVTCAWIERFRKGRETGRTELVDQARSALGAARAWSALKEIAADGGWSDAVWEYADIVAAGAPRPRDDEMLADALDGGLGCDD